MLTVTGLDTYYGASHVLSGVGLEVARGEVVALLGRNGAGKTTTMASVAGFLPTRRGSITLDGERLDHRPSFRRVRAGLGYVPQSGRIFAGLTVRENLEIVRGRGAANGDAWTVERAFETFPGLARLAGRDGGLLSGGERQMLAVARALMANPHVVLLDEPSEGLAPVVVERLGELIRSLRDKHVGVLLAEQSHRFALEIADRAYLIEKGRIRHQAAAADLVDSLELERYLGV
ncbi:MAG: branched-chain amino acid transport system ATP-binding protein [Solirubrobacteraceae bacterium]|nr:branched-chain amino acid transport system ATP-binding protein [Solirubrobacteraceae bacterium]